MTYLHTIRSVRPLGGAVLELVFEDGRPRRVDLSDLVRAGGVFALLANPAIFAQVGPDHRGRALVWPNGVDLCADSLWIAAEGGGSMPAGELVTTPPRP